VLVETTAALPYDLRAPGQARSLARRCLCDWGLSELLDSVELVVSELVTNAVRHGAAPVEMTISREADHILVTVHDGAAAVPPQPRVAEPADDGGRGMHLVAVLTSRWGYDLQPAGKTVWAELPVGA
jgi:anti-sigma regulatory factor (Ser/Thr protein kinase)